MTPGALARRGPWYSAAPTGVAVPHHVPSSTSRNRFNDGGGAFALRYLAAEPTIALLEAAALHGAYATGFVAPLRPRSWTLFHYEVVVALNVVDFADHAIRSGAPTTVQELTGDWLGYHHRRMGTLPVHPPAVNGSRSLAPSQELAARLHALPSVHGFLTPSAKTPLTANLVLFFGRLPPGAILHRGTATVVI